MIKSSLNQSSEFSSAVSTGSDDDESTVQLELEDDGKYSVGGGEETELGLSSIEEAVSDTLLTLLAIKNQ